MNVEDSLNTILDKIEAIAEDISVLDREVDAISMYLEKHEDVEDYKKKYLELKEKYLNRFYDLFKETPDTDNNEVINDEYEEFDYNLLDFSASTE